jgi:hypothetical protein
LRILFLCKKNGIGRPDAEKANINLPTVKKVILLYHGDNPGRLIRLRQQKKCFSVRAAYLVFVEEKMP